jgi:hypothetical protein
MPITGASNFFDIIVVAKAKPGPFGRRDLLHAALGLSAVLVKHVNEG